MNKLLLSILMFVISSTSLYAAKGQFANLDLTFVFHRISINDSYTNKTLQSYKEYTLVKITTDENEKGFLQTKNLKYIITDIYMVKNGTIWMHLVNEDGGKQMALFVMDNDELLAISIMLDETRIVFWD